jgi:prepilin-type N-terminal cleavage/methylation domain-containing protein
MPPRLARPKIPVRGFTLIELLVVIVVIGVLATLVAPNVCHPRFTGERRGIKFSALANSDS